MGSNKQKLKLIFLLLLFYLFLSAILEEMQISTKFTVLANILADAIYYLALGGQGIVILAGGLVLLLTGIVYDSLSGKGAIFNYIALIYYGTVVYLTYKYGIAGYNVAGGISIIILIIANYLVAGKMTKKREVAGKLSVKNVFINKNI